MSEGENDPLARLVILIQKGVDPQENCRKLHDRSYGMVYNFFCRKGLTKEEAKDLTQDTFIRVFLSVEGLQNPQGFRTWLFKIACNVFRNALRHGSAHKRDGHEVSLDALMEPKEGAPARLLPGALLVTSDPVRVAEMEEWRRRLRAEMDLLPRQMRQCLHLRLNEDLKYREIALVMGISIQTVKAHLHQAQQRLRSRLEEGAPAPGPDL